MAAGNTGGQRTTGEWDAMLYDAAFPLPGYPQWEIDVYVALARAVGGPVLELGAGTGRVLTALLGSGADAYGLELDPRMAQAGREKLQRVGVDDPQVRLLVGDARSFDHQRKYGLAIFPYNSLPLLQSPADIDAMLGCVAANLRPRGEFAFDMILPQNVPPQERTLDVAVGLGGVMVELRIEGHYDSGPRVYTLDRRYRFPDGSVETRTLRLQYPSVPELERQVARAGFRFVTPAIDERGRAVGPNSRVYLARLRRA